MSDRQNICCFCKVDDNTPLYSTFDIFGNTYTINECHNCKAHILAPPPDEATLKMAYDTSYYGETEEKFSSPNIETVLDHFRKRRAKYTSRYLSNGDKILDIGCGNGRFLQHLLKFGKFELHGTELESNSAKRASKIPELNLKIGFLNKDSYKSESFDVITMFHVFEHLTEPKETLEIILDILKKDGTLIISFPNINSLQSRMFKGKWLHLDPPRHLLLFIPKDFVRICEEMGFKLIREKYISTEQNVYGMIQSILNTFFRKREILFEYLKGNKDYIKEFSSFNIFIQKMFFYFTFPFFAAADVFISMLKKGATVEFTFRKTK
jgi:2-polyprenyl-3-methyl-5-hydroxy-6-metoxy-1,4-benzoquinol methylase